jgi:uncharacterized membrane protein
MFNRGLNVRISDYNLHTVILNTLKALVQRGRSMIRILRVLIIVSLVGPAAGAGVYKWVDEQGRVHFGDRPQSEAAMEMQIKIDPRSSPPAATEAERARNRKRLLEMYQEDREAKKEAAKKQKEERAQRAAECKRTRSKLAQYSNAAGLYEDGEGGERRYLSFEARDRYMAGLRQEVGKLCR